MRDQWYYWSAQWTYQCTWPVNGQRSQTVVKLGSTACTGLYIKYQGRCAHWIIVLMLFPEWWQAFADAIGQGSTIKYVQVPQKVSWNTAQRIFKQFLNEDYSFLSPFFHESLDCSCSQASLGWWALETSADSTKRLLYSFLVLFASNSNRSFEVCRLRNEYGPTWNSISVP